MHMMKRGLLALTMVAAVGGATEWTVGLPGQCHPTRGREVLTGSQYAVGAGVAVGPFTEHGVVHNHGNVTDIPSLPTDPANSNRHTLVDPTGSFTLLTTGRDESSNRSQCQSGYLRRPLHHSSHPRQDRGGTGPMPMPPGASMPRPRSGVPIRTATGCDTNQNDPSAFSTTNVVAKVTSTCTETRSPGSSLRGSSKPGFTKREGLPTGGPSHWQHRSGVTRWTVPTDSPSGQYATARWRRQGHGLLLPSASSRNTAEGSGRTLVPVVPG